MVTQDGGTRTLERALQAVVALVAPHLHDSSVARSVLEDAIDRSTCPSSHAGGLRLALDDALSDARIRVREDLSGLDAWPGVLPAEVLGTPAPPTPTDPVAAGRRRLDLDSRSASTHLHNVILTAEEEVGLTLIARPDGEPLPPGGFASLEGDARVAAEAMVLHNLRLAHAMARSYAGQGLEHDDLYAHAVIGLLRAVELFDPAAGFKFSTYATHWLRQAVTRALANESRAIRIPVHMWEVVRKVGATRERLTIDGRPPSARVLAEELHLDVEKVIECLRLLPAVLSLETPLGADQFTLGDLVADRSHQREHVEVSGVFPEDVEPLLSTMDYRSAEVMRMRFGLAPYDQGHTLDEIGHVFGVTRERIRQIESKAFGQMRAHLRRKGYSVPTVEKRKKVSSVRATGPALGDPLLSVATAGAATKPVPDHRSPDHVSSLRTA